MFRSKILKVNSGKVVMLMVVKEITFSSDTAARKEWFTGLSFSHP
jgi:hypothetical protein